MPSDTPNTGRITIDAFLVKPKGLSIEEEAAYRLAVRAHGTQSRTKIMSLEDEQEKIHYPYAVHLNMVHYLLKQAGVTDKKVLSAAFMHDMMEDCYDANNQKYNKNSLISAYEASLQQTKQELGEELSSDHQFAKKVVALVDESTNPELMPLGKRAYQVNKMRKASADVKLVKIADQVASLVEDVLVKSALPNDKLRKFVVKAHDVVAACKDDSLPNKILQAMEDEPYKLALSLVEIRERHGKNHGDAEQSIRAGFDLDEVIARAKENIAALPSRSRRFVASLEVDEGKAHVALMIENDHIHGVRISTSKTMRPIVQKQVNDLVDALEVSGHFEVDAVPYVKTKIISEARKPTFEMMLHPPMLQDDFAHVLSGFAEKMKQEKVVGEHQADFLLTNTLRTLQERVKERVDHAQNIPAITEKVIPKKGKWGERVSKELDKQGWVATEEDIPTR